MSISKELIKAPTRFKDYIDRLIQLFQDHEIRSIKNLANVARSDKEFINEWRAIWNEIVKADGGKISLTTMGAIIGAVLGGVGIAAGGGAIGLPLAAVLGLGGLITGSEIDSTGILSEKQHITLKLTEPLYSSIIEAAEISRTSPEELIVNILNRIF